MYLLVVFRNCSVLNLGRSGIWQAECNDKASYIMLRHIFCQDAELDETKVS